MRCSISTEKIALVTGASRGIGKGVARALGSSGYTVWITGRAAGNGALEATAAEVDASGGRGIAVHCDHADDAQVARVFERIGAEAGCLDILVNNAAAVDSAALMAEGPFFEKPLDALSAMIDVGLRSHYVASYHGAKLMTAAPGGLIAFISFYGAVSYFHGPAYGAAKAGTDKMAFDIAVDMEPYGVASVSLWPGIVGTEVVQALDPAILATLPPLESPEFTGHVIEAIHDDADRMALSGKTLIVAEMARRYGIRDMDGSQPDLLDQAMGRPPVYVGPAG
ncbi:MAG: SDR family NAD(P)-dependent oxidoreductase [Sphingomonadaceae bacterium]